MNKASLLTTIIFITLPLNALASYTTSGTSGSINVDAGSATTVYYTEPTDGSSNPNYTAIDIPLNGEWHFDFSDLNNVAFSGNIHLGNYETQTNVTGLPVIDGHLKFSNGKHTLSGVGRYDESTNTFSYSLPSSGANSSKASDFSHESATCKNGKTSFFGTVCGTWENTTGDWEGVTIKLKFSEDRSTFMGSVTGIEQSGRNLTANTTTVTFSINGSSETH